MRLIIFLCFLFFLSSCATVRGWFGDNVVTEAVGLAPTEEPIKYSENPQMTVPASRQYKRMTKSKMEDEAELHSQAGSMWVNEGQTSYLFVQNKSRREGDVLSVRLEGSGLKQVETKVGVIKNLLKQLEEQLKQQNAPADDKLADNASKRAPASAPKEEKEDLSSVQNVSSRLVEKLTDGNYRIKGQQPLMIGQREYKVIVTGMLRPEDYNDEGVGSDKLLDPQFDVVSIRRKVSNEE